MSMQYQDWDNVVLKKHDTVHQKEKKSNEIDSPSLVRRQTSNSPGVKVNSKKVIHEFDPENISAPTTSTHELGIAIQQARIAENNKLKMNLTQTELDNLCSFPKNTIRDYENSSAIINPEQLNKINRVLGIKLPRPHKK